MNPLQVQFLVLMVAERVSRSHQDVIDYLQAENRVLRERLRDKRLLFCPIFKHIQGEVRCLR